MKATQEHHTAPNVLQRQFKIGMARKVLLTDSSYRSYYGGKTAYLSAVIDAETIEQVFGKR